MSIRLFTIFVLALFLAFSPSRAELQVGVARPEIYGKAGGPESEAGRGGPLTVELFAVEPSFEWLNGLLAGSSGSEPVVRASVALDGRFRIEAPAIGVWRLQVSASGAVPMQRLPLPLDREAALAPVRLPADAGCRARVTDAAGRPRAGVWVVAETASPEVLRRHERNGWKIGARMERTDATGWVTLPRLVEERLDFTVITGAGAAIAHARAVTEKAHLRLPPPGPMRTIGLRDAAGRPVDGAVVAAGSLVWPLGVTAVDGRLAIGDGIESGGDPPLQVLTAGGRWQLGAPTEVTADGTAWWHLPNLRPLTGRVRAAATGEPLSGALVWPGHEPAAWVLTAEDGRFRVAAPVVRSFLQAQAAAFLPRARWLGPDEGSETDLAAELVLELEPAAAIRGRVEDLKGAAVAGAEVVAAPDSQPAHPAFRPEGVVERAYTDAAGRFAVGGLVGGEGYTVGARREGFRSAYEQHPARDSAPELRLVLTPLRPAGGRVVDQDGGPVAGAEVGLWNAASERRPQLLRPGNPRPEDPRRGRLAVLSTDEEGRFDLPDLEAPAVHIEARGPGFAPTLVLGVAVDPDREAAAGERVDLGTVLLIPEATIRGTVTDVAGEALEGATVWLGSEGSLRGLGPDRLRRAAPGAMSNATGTFEIGELEPGFRGDLLIARTGFQPHGLAAVEAGTGEELVVELESAARLAGKVVDDDGAAVAGARIRLRPNPDAARSSFSRSAHSDEDGRFVFDELAGGAVVVDAAAEGLVPSSPVEVDLEPGAEIVDLVLELAAGARIEGTVTDRDGGPLAGVRLTAHRQQTESDPQGSFRLAGVPTGTADFEAYHPGYDRARRELTVEPGVNRVEVVLTGGDPVAGRVLDAGGAPVERAAVRLEAEDPRDPRQYRATSDPSGHFEVARVAAGSYAVVAEKRGYTPGRAERAIVVAGVPVSGIEVILESGISISGQLLGLESNSVAGAQVVARRFEPPPGSAGGSGLEVAGTVDHAAGYRIEGLGAGGWLLLASAHGGRRSASGRVVLSRGDRSVERDLEFGAGAILSGTARLRGSPLPEARVSLTGLDRSVERSAVTDHLGAFRFEDLEAGRFRIALSQARHALSHARTVELVGDLSLDIDLWPSWIRGSVVSALDGGPLESALVQLVGVEGEGIAASGRFTAATGPDGGFEVLLADAGRFRLTARRDGFAQTSVPLEVRSGEDLEGLLLTLDPTEGLELRVRLANGEVPPMVSVHLLDATGRAILSETRPADTGGRARFATLPAGEWSLWVAAPGAAGVPAAATVPGAPLALTLPQESRLRLESPALAAAGVPGTLRLLDARGEHPRVVDSGGELRHDWALLDGSTLVQGLPAGEWTLRVTAADGRVFEAAATTVAGYETLVTLE